MVLGDGEARRIRLGVGVHEQVCSVPKDCLREDVVMGAPHRTEGVEPGPRKTGLTRIRACVSLPPTDSQRGLAAS